MPILDALKRLLNDPVGAVLEIDPTARFSAIERSPLVWHFSSFELMNGVDISDLSETIGGHRSNSLSPY